MELICKELLADEKIKKLREFFEKGEPYKHVLVKEFLNEDFARKIFPALKEEKFEHKECDLFSLSQTEDFKFVKNKVLKEFYDFFRSHKFMEWIEKVSRIKLKMGTIDMAGSLYSGCDYLLCHDDQLKGRKIAFVYYLSEDFQEEDGGSFVMFSSEDGKPGKVLKKYLPLWNSFLMFEVSEKSFHEVEENFSDKERYSIGGWFH